MGDLLGYISGNVDQMLTPHQVFHLLVKPFRESVHDFNQVFICECQIVGIHITRPVTQD